MPKQVEFMHISFAGPNIIMSLLAIALLFSVLSYEANSVLGEIGTTSSYDAPYIPTRCDGNRLDQFPPGNLFATVSKSLWDDEAACGRRCRLRCLSGTNNPCKRGAVDVKVVDFCPKSPCPSTVLWSNEAFSALSRSPTAKINIEYIQI